MFYRTSTCMLHTFRCSNEQNVKNFFVKSINLHWISKLKSFAIKSCWTFLFNFVKNKSNISFIAKENQYHQKEIIEIVIIKKFIESKLTKSISSYDDEHCKSISLLCTITYMSCYRHTTYIIKQNGFKTVLNEEAMYCT